MAFNPQAAKDNRPKSNGIPPNDYLVAITDWEHKTSAKGNSYKWTQVEVIAGAASGKKFKDMIMLNLDDAIQGAKFATLLEACGWDMTQSIDEEDDRALREAIINRPFKAAVKREQNGDYTNNRIHYVITDAKKISSDDRERMEQWFIDHKDDSVGGGSDDRDAPPPSDDDYGGYGGGNGKGDDIPFLSADVNDDVNPIARVIREF